MTVLVHGPFDDRVLAELGTPVITGSGPEHPGDSYVRVDGVPDAQVKDKLAMHGVNSYIVEPPQPPPPVAHLVKEVEHVAQEVEHWAVRYWRLLAPALIILLELVRQFH